MWAHEVLERLQELKIPEQRLGKSYGAGKCVGGACWRHAEASTQPASD